MRSCLETLFFFCTALQFRLELLLRDITSGYHLKILPRDTVSRYWLKVLPRATISTYCPKILSWATRGTTSSHCVMTLRRDTALKQYHQRSFKSRHGLLRHHKMPAVSLVIHNDGYESQIYQESSEIQAIIYPQNFCSELSPHLSFCPG